jgi:hypothetical protein
LSAVQEIIIWSRNQKRRYQLARTKEKIEGLVVSEHGDKPSGSTKDEVLE